MLTITFVSALRGWKRKRVVVVLCWGAAGAAGMATNQGCTKFLTVLKFRPAELQHSNVNGREKAPKWSICMYRYDIHTVLSCIYTVYIS